ncbi:hypothetical protein JYU29_17425 [Tianweitania sp. BSSL-BM11]|uniref:Endonuclease n=1 Tax=Tianweitania aestuarii TaxID=2814886 RepID=A0ABS5RZJ5_9HYPH|nr:hypothetical protein [Tianweitania aestuarii]MBS9722478.1 hypothetical protein [Tianweitania aestuarii]
MSMKMFAIAAAVLSATAGVASAQAVGTQTEANVGLFDQGGAYYRGPDSSPGARMDGANIDRSTTSSIGSVMTNGSSAQPRIRSVVRDNKAVPADTRNESGLGMFDSVN